jgi:hypothetical protein
VLALLRKGRRTATIRQETGVTTTATATRDCHPPITVVVQLGKDLTGVQIAHHRALGHRYLEALSTSAVEILSLSMHTITSTSVRVISEGEQRGHIVVGNQPDVPTIAAVAAIWATVHHRPLTPE